MRDIKHSNPLYLSLMANEIVRGGMIDSYTKSSLLLKNHIENAIRYKGSMYHTSSLDRTIYSLMRREADIFYGLMSLDVEEWIKTQRYAFLKLFIKYRLQNCYKRRVTV